MNSELGLYTGKAAYNASLGNGLPDEKGSGAFFQSWLNLIDSYKLKVQANKK